MLVRASAAGPGAPASRAGGRAASAFEVGGGAEERFPTSSDSFESWRWRNKQFNCWLAEQVRRGGAEGRRPRREGGHRAGLLGGSLGLERRPTHLLNPPRLSTWAFACQNNCYLENRH